MSDKTLSLAGLKEKVKEVDGHWLWLGEVNHFGVPVIHLIRFGDRVPVYKLALRLSGRREMEMERSCNEPRCISPGHRLPPSVAKGVVSDTCKHGHSWAQFGSKDNRGHRVCVACRRERARKIKRSSPANAGVDGTVKRRPGGMKETCKHGHDMATHRVVSLTNNKIYCGACAKISDMKQKLAKAEKEFLK